MSSFKIPTTLRQSLAERIGGYTNLIGRNSLRDIQLTQVQNNLAGHISEATLGHFKLTPSKVVAGDPPSGKPRKLKNDKTIKAGNNLVTPPSKPTVPLNNTNIVTPPTPPTATATAGRVRYCHFFQSTAGCFRGPSCAHSHTTPPRGDPAREWTKKYLAERNLGLSPVFLRGE